MAISAYTGLQRSGKSYSVVEHVIISALKESRKVYTNIPMNDEMCLQDFGCQVENFSVIDIPLDFFDSIESGSVVVIDECWRLWPAGMKPTTMSESHKSFITEHGHRVKNGKCIEIAIVTQDLSQICTFVRNLVETTYRSTKNTALGSSKTFRVDIYTGPVSGPNPPARLRQDQKLGCKYNEKVYKYYVSQTQNEDSKHGSEKSSDKRSSFFSSSFVKFAPIALILGSIFVFYTISNVFETYAPEKKIDDIPKISNFKENPDLQKVPSKPKISNPFHDMKSNIIFNSGVFPEIEYKIKFYNFDSSVDINVESLENLGFKVTKINSCMISLLYQNIKSFIYCPNHEDKRSTVFANNSF